jgi:hypothetical protein
MDETPEEKAIRKALKKEADKVEPKPALGKIKSRIAAKAQKPGKADKKGKR